MSLHLVKGLEALPRFARPVSGLSLTGALKNHFVLFQWCQKLTPMRENSENTCFQMSSFKRYE